MPRQPAIPIHPGGESSHSESYNSDGENSGPLQQESSFTDEDLDGDVGYFDEVQPFDSASASNEIPPSRPAPTRTALRHHRVPRHQQQYSPGQTPAPNPSPSLDSSGELSGRHGWGYQPQPQPQPVQRNAFYGGVRPQPQSYPHHPPGPYLTGYPSGNQMVSYGAYGPGPFTPMTNNSSGASYFEPRHMYDLTPYQHGYYGPPQYSLPPHIQQFHIAQPPAVDSPAKPASPAPKDPPVDVEKLKLEAQLAAIKAHEEKQQMLEEQRKRDAKIRKEAEESFAKKMEEMKQQQEEARKEIARAREDAERAALARIEAERRAAEERARQEAEAFKRAEDNARKKLEAEMMAAEERRQREQEERLRIEQVAKARLEAAMKAEAEAKAAAEKKAAEEAERLKLIMEDAKRSAESEARAKLEAEKEAAKKAAEAEAEAKKEREALRKRVQEETQVKLEEAAKAKTDKAPIKFKDAVGRKFSFPFHICSTWQGMEELIKQAFVHVDVIGPHVQQGHYDLTGPNGEIILPSVWEKVVQPDWSISMTMWPVAEISLSGRKMAASASGRRGVIPTPPPAPGARSAGHRASAGMGAGVQPSVAWAVPGGRHHPHMPANIDIVDVDTGATKTSKGSKKNSTMLTFFAGKPAKKRSNKK